MSKKENWKKEKPPQLLTRDKYVSIGESFLKKTRMEINMMEKFKPPMMREIEDLLDEIDEITKVTCSTWYPQYEDAIKDRTSSPATAQIIWDIIRSRSNYVIGLKERVWELRRGSGAVRHGNIGHKCGVGCPLYASRHSIDVDGNCNMGCC